MSAPAEQNRFASLSRRQIIGAGAALVATPAVVAAAYAAPGRQDSTPAASPEATPGGTPGATPGATPDPAAAAQDFNVSMVDLAFEPAEFTIPADTNVTVTVVNNGQLPHYWAIPDQNLASPEAAGGDTTPHHVAVNLPAGTYDFICPVPGHAQAGMVGVLTVE